MHFVEVQNLNYSLEHISVTVVFFVKAISTLFSQTCKGRFRSDNTHCMHGTC